MNNQFVTIVAFPQTREAFTKFGDANGGTDKLTMEAIWQTMDEEKVLAKLAELKQAEADAKAAKKAAKALEKVEAAAKPKKVEAPVDAETKVEVAQAVAELFENEVDVPAEETDRLEGVIEEAAEEVAA